jgi:hypothetical protein
LHTDGEEILLLFALTAGLGPAISNAAEAGVFGLQYGTYYLRSLLRRRPDLQRLNPRTLRVIETEVERRAPTIIQRVGGRLARSTAEIVVPDPTPQTIIRACGKKGPRKNLKKVMGKTASQETGLPGMVWLHKIAHSLGGSDRPENLVAGTTEANQVMLAFERIALYAVKLNRRVDIQAEASVVEGTRVGRTMTYRMSMEVGKQIELDDENKLIVWSFETILDGTVDLTSRAPVPIDVDNAFRRLDQVARKPRIPGPLKDHR